MQIQLRRYRGRVMSFNIKGIVILLIVFIMLFLFTNNILYELAKKKCTEVEIKPGT